MDKAAQLIEVNNFREEGIVTRNILQGVIHVTGEHDVGKTTFALECGAPPERICFFDHDIKGRPTIQELQQAGVEFGAYHDLAEINAGLREVEFHRKVLGVFDTIEAGRFDAIVFDTWTAFADTTHAYVLANPRQFREHWSATGRIKGPQQWKEARRYEAELLGRLLRLAPTVIIVTHLKDYYLNNVRTGKQIPAASKVLNRVPRLRIWLRHNPDGRPVPIGLVLKRLDRKVVTDHGLRTVSTLPRRIVPLDGESSLWDAIWRYWNDPVGDRPPLDTEKPDEFELSILDGTLTAEQKRTLNLMLEQGLVPREEEELLSVDEQPPSTWEELLEKHGKTLDDLGGIVAARSMTVDEIVAKDEEWGGE